MKSSIKANYFYNLLYRIVTLVTPLITAPYISRILGAEGIGQYSYTYAISHYFLIFAVLGVSDYGNRAIARVRDDKNERSRVFSEIFTLQAFLSLAIIALYFVYAIQFAESRVLALMQGMNVISALFDVTWLLFGLELFLVTTIRNVIVKVGTVAAILFFVKDSSDVLIYTIIMAAGTLVGQLSVWPLLRKYVQYKNVNLRSVLSHLKPNLILFLPVIANNLLGYFDKIMIGNLSIDAELGCYDNAEKLLSIPNSLVTALGTVMLPRVSNSVAQGKIQKVKDMTQKSMLFIVFATSALSFGISAVAKEFVPFFFGDGFDLVVPLIYSLAPYIVFVSWANVLKTQCLLPTGKDKVFVCCLVSGATLNVVLNAILIPSIGAIGAAIATTISEALIAIMETVFVRKEIELKRYIVQSVPFIGIGLVMYLCIMRLSFESAIVTLAVKIFIGGCIYLLLSLLYIRKCHSEVWDSLHLRKGNR